jgi:hypothetical protein
VYIHGYETVAFDGVGGFFVTFVGVALALTRGQHGGQYDGGCGEQTELHAHSISYMSCCWKLKVRTGMVKMEKSAAGTAICRVFCTIPLLLRYAYGTLRADNTWIPFQI